MRTSLRHTILLVLPVIALFAVSSNEARAQFMVESVSIEHGAVNVPLTTDISVTFSEAIAPVFIPGALDALGDAIPIDLELFDPECPVAPAGIFVVPGGCPSSVSISGDSRTITLEGVQLEADTDQTLLVLYAVSQGGESLAFPSVTRFSTGPTLPSGGFAGSVSTVGPTPQGTILVAIEAPLNPLAEEFEPEPHIAFANADGDYEMDFVADGTYHIIGFQIDFNDPETALNNLLIGTVDADDNKVADLLEISGGAVVSNADLSTTNERATAAELNTPALDLLHQEDAGAALALAVGAGLNVDGTAVSWIYVYTSLASGTLYTAASVGPFVFPTQMVDLGEDGNQLILVLAGNAVPEDFGDSDGAAGSFLDAGGSEFLSEYESAIGVSILMNANLYAFIELLLNGDLSGFLQPVADVFDRFDVAPQIESTLSKKTGEVWIVAFIAPFGPALHLVAMDDAGNPLLVIGSASARENEAAAAEAATAWASDVVLVTVDSDELPVDGNGNALAWGFNYYSASKDSVLSVSASGGAMGRVVTTFVLGPDEVPSTNALPDNWIDSPAAVAAGRDRGQAFASTHVDALAEAVLSRGLQTGNPDLAIWRFGFTGTAGTGETESLDVDIDAQSGVFVALEDDRVLPTDFELGQNYPNPFNPATVIPYRLSERSHVSLEVFDALGRRIATLVDGVQPEGAYNVTWGPSASTSTAPPSGVYIYRLTTGGTVKARTMMLLK